MKEQQGDVTFLSRREVESLHIDGREWAGSWAVARRFKELRQLRSEPLKRQVADLTLDKSIRAEVVRFADPLPVLEMEEDLPCRRIRWFPADTPPESL